MRKFRLYFDKEAEEQWLNEMCSQGWEMTNFFFGVYTFAPCSPGFYTYQVDMPEFPGGRLGRDQKKREYIDFVESTGAEYVCSWGYYMIFRKETEKGEFKLYTDAESQMKLYQRIRRLFVMVELIELSILFFQFGNFIRPADFAGESPGMLLFICVCIGMIAFFIIGILAMIIRLTIRIQRLKKQR